MPTKKQIFRRHTKKEIGDIIKKHNFNVAFTSKTTKTEMVNDLFKLKNFKEFLKTSPKKEARKLSPAQRKNADRLRKLKKSNIGKTESEKIHIIEPKPIEVQQIEKDFKFEKQIKQKPQVLADLKTMEGKTTKDGVSKQFHQQHNQKLDDMIGLDTDVKQMDKKTLLMSETKTTDEFDRRIEGAISAKVNREMTTIANRVSQKKSVKEPFLNEIDRLHQEDPNNPLFTLMKLLKERDKEREKSALSDINKLTTNALSNINEKPLVTSPVIPLPVGGSKPPIQSLQELIREIETKTIEEEDSERIKRLIELGNEEDE